MTISKKRKNLLIKLSI